MASKDHGLTPIELSSFCSEIALMLGAGMPLYAGMEALEKTYEDDAHAALYRGVSETLTQTGSLREDGFREAMAEYPGITLLETQYYRCAAWASERAIWRT